MAKKYGFLVSFVLLLSTATMLPATTTITWSNDGHDGDWNNNANWTGGVKPNATSDYAAITMTTGPVITTGQTIGAWRILLNGAGNGTLTVNGGTLNAGNHIYVADTSTARGTLNIDSGEITILGTLYVSRDSGSIGIVNLSGGTISCSALSFGTSNNLPGVRIDITGSGKLIITGDATNNIELWKGKNWITAYGGKGDVDYNYNITSPGKTTVWAVLHENATNPNPGNAAIYVPISGTNLIWKPGAYAGSHNIYFGTIAGDVNSAQRLAGDVDNSGIVDFNDISRLTLYWLTDPAGSVPYAGVNGDGMVDLLDYAQLSQDWMTGGNPVFRCNQDANSWNPGTLAAETTYYWRVDEVNGPQTIKGDVWSFTTAPAPETEYSLVGKVMCGYQGWFNCPGDGTTRGWIHWSNRADLFDPTTCTVEMWPDMTEMSAAEKFLASGFDEGGNHFYTFSSYKRDTVLRHFLWMAQYGIDGIFLQRFGTELTPGDQAFTHRNAVLSYCKEGANTYGRKYAVMYDLTSLREGTVLNTISNDWRFLVDTMQVSRDPCDRGYITHNGKPVVAVWGIGWTKNDTDRNYTWAECLDLINFLKDDPVYGGNVVMVGVRDRWRRNLTDPTMLAIVTKADIISPWSVGAFDSGSLGTYVTDKWYFDKQWCTDNHKDYMPVIFPGFSWSNLKNDPGVFNDTPRNGGQFLWDQVKATISTVGTNMIYVAMFDEVDEGTAIFKVSNNPPRPGGVDMFITYNMDGHNLPSDEYLWLVGQATRALRGQINPVPSIRPARP
jgi:hypothetical protein